MSAPQPGDRTRLALAVTIVVVEVLVVTTTPAQRRLWMLRAVRRAARTAGRAARALGETQMRREAAGVPADYTLPAAASRARDGLWGLYERLRGPA